MVAARKTKPAGGHDGRRDETPEGTRDGGAGTARLPGREEISAYHLVDETRLVGGLVERAVFTEDERRRTAEIAGRLVAAARANRGKHGGVDAFMREYGLSSEEGVILMCIAESLLRIPDAETADQLIAEKIAAGHWDRHIGHSDSTFVNASTWGLMLTGRVVKLKDAKGASPWTVVKRLLARSGEPVIRQAVRQAVRLLGDQFVLGRTIGEAVARGRGYEAKGYRISYDMLGEAARTDADALAYLERYMAALDTVGAAAGPLASEHPDALIVRPSLSVKLSALHPRFEPGKEARLDRELLPRVIEMMRAARARGVAVTFDSEEQDRLEPTLAMFAAAYSHPAVEGWTGLGIAVQAYGKRAIPVLRWLRRLAEAGGRRIPVRLVKGAYWDTEIKLAQERGLADYPVFTRKMHTDVSYLAAMRLIISDPKCFFPQLATHNAHTLAAALASSGDAAFEFQRLHGMGEALYDEVVGAGKLARACRIYAPVGGHEDLLAYLVRRLLENGANTSFVNRLADDRAAIADLVRDPVEAAERARAASVRREDAPGPRREREGAPRLIPRPREILLPERRVAAGFALAEPAVRNGLLLEMSSALKTTLVAAPVIGSEVRDASPRFEIVTCPHDRRERIGTVVASTARDIEAALAGAAAAAHAWDMTPAVHRARVLDLAADLFERDRARLMAVVVREAGKTLEAAQAELREAVDHLRFAAAEARRLLAAPVQLPGPTGEANILSYRARGPVAAISPWNFPLAIFTGQIATALAAGNPVIAKPAAQTPVTAFLATRLMQEAGLPPGVLQLLPGDGQVGAALIRDRRVCAVAFTGSSETAWAIQRTLAERRATIVPLIAETGGINAMIADSSALAEQVVRDAVHSAFDSAGQRCSAARVLFLQGEIAASTMAMLKGAIEALDVGDPMDIATDVGPVIDETAQDTLEGHKLRMQREGETLIDVELPASCRVGTYVAPAAYVIDRVERIEREVFGPILHVVRYDGGHLGKVVEAINGLGYGLTLGLHSRIAAAADYVAEHARVGNLYVNRNQIGAVVGMQPFGGEGLSGTGPKAGGPNALSRFMTERVRSTDVTATGGNVALLGLGEPGD